jgi:large subunit ribosomal protein L4
MPRKARRAAVRSMLTTKVTENRLRVLDQLQLEEGKTKRVVALLQALNVDGKALISLGAADENTVRAARNIPGVKTLPAANMNALDLLDYDTLILTREGVDILERFLS